MDVPTSLSEGRLWAREFRAGVNHKEVLEEVTSEAEWSSHYLFMVLVSAGIAELGLLLSSPAVIIGAMLLSPMMRPIIGLGFGIALFDANVVRKSLLSLGGGILLAVIFCTVIAFESPLQTITPEIASRTRPNLFDLGIAILSGAAGTYAMIRGRLGAIVGVAIAVAVMPPLAVVGFGLATLNDTIVSGASFLFLTNLTAISVTAAAVARVYGFGHSLSRTRGWLQALLIIVALIGFGIPLSIALRQIAWEAFASREVRDAIQSRFGARTRISNVEIAFDKEPIEISSVVFTPKLVSGAEESTGRSIAKTLGRNVTLAIEQVRVGDAAAAKSELAAARKEDGVSREATKIADALGLIAGVAPDEVLVDPIHRVARVEATPLPAASIATYRALEQRAASVAPGWAVYLIPPAVPLPDIAAAVKGALPPDAVQNLDVTAWAAERTKLPIGVTGRDAKMIVSVLQQRGIRAVVMSRRGRTTHLEWLSPTNAQMGRQARH